jgi:hypothetical protein
MTQTASLSAEYISLNFFFSRHFFFFENCKLNCKLLKYEKIQQRGFFLKEEKNPGGKTMTSKPTLRDERNNLITNLIVSLAQNQAIDRTFLNSLAANETIIKETVSKECIALLFLASLGRNNKTNKISCIRILFVLSAETAFDRPSVDQCLKPRAALNSSLELYSFCV